jgi:hypothetical protein
MTVLILIFDLVEILIVVGGPVGKGYYFLHNAGSVVLTVGCTSLHVGKPMVHGLSEVFQKKFIVSKFEESLIGQWSLSKFRILKL